MLYANQCVLHLVLERKGNNQKSSSKLCCIEYILLYVNMAHITKAKEVPDIEWTEADLSEMRPPSQDEIERKKRK